MRMSQEEKDRSHARIIASGAKVVRKHGLERASVNDVMKDAGLTHGGFYKHFESKDALLVAALESAFSDIEKMLDPALADAAAAAKLADFHTFYLSDGHVASAAIGCPVAALAGDIGRATAPLKARFGAGVKRIVALLGRGTSRSETARRVRATRQLAMMAGAVMIARASDPHTAREVLSACRERQM